MIWLIGIFCLCLCTNFGQPVEISEESRFERAILGGGGGNHLLEALGGGSPGRDFPVLNTVPKTNFDCHGLLPGYYADENYGCQVFHVCHTDQRKDSFLCPNGTIFHQVKLVCDWWYNVDCASTNLHFDVNLEFGKPSSNFAAGSRSKTSQTPVSSTAAKSNQLDGFSNLAPSTQFGGSRIGTQPEHSGVGGGFQFTQTGGGIGIALPSHFGSGSGGTQSSQLGRIGATSHSSQFSGNKNDVSSQSSHFGLSKVEQPSFDQFDIGRDKPVPSQPSFSSVASRSQNQHQSSFQTNQRNPQTSFGGSGINQFGDNRNIKEVVVNKRPVSSGIPFPPLLTRQTDSNLAQRSGRVSSATSRPVNDPLPTTLSPRSNNFQIPNSLTFPPRKINASSRSSQNNLGSGKVPAKPGKVSTVKKVTVNKRPIASVSTQQTSGIPLPQTAGFGHQEVRIIDDSRAANQFFNLGTPVRVTSRNNVGRPLPRVDVQSAKKPTLTTTKTKVVTHSSNLGRPLPSTNNVNNFGKPLPRVQPTTQRTIVRNQNANNFGIPLPSPPSNIRSNVAQNGNVGFPLSINTVQSNIGQQRPVSRTQGQENSFGRPLPVVTNQPAVPSVRAPLQNTNRGSVRFGISNQGSARTRVQRPTVTANQPTGFTIVVDDDDFDDINDPFDDDRFDDDRFDDDRFDNDRFDDDRFDDDRFDDDRFDNDRFEIRNKLDDDRFDNDPFDDDRFDFDDDDDDDDFDDRRNRFDNDRNFNFGRRPRGSSSNLLVAHKESSKDGPAKVLEIIPPPEIQLPPPLLTN